MSSTLLTVTQVNRFLRSLIEGDGRLADITITGEISNFTQNSRSGHMYFSLKDSQSVLKSVMFAAAARRLAFTPQDGMKVIIRGRVSVYEPSGQYQLYAETMQPDGVGALALAFDQLKERLAGEGLFDPERKRPLPSWPMRIGVVTSPTGAAVQDILQILGRRWPVAEVVFCPVQVQGDAAVPQLILAVEKLNHARACDVIIIGRGGGSMEDLWAFNNESLARTVAWSQIPVVSAVGHETDFTICDFAADLRAPTPSAAAELCTPELEAQLENLEAYHQYFCGKALQVIGQLRQRTDLLLQRSPLSQPREYTRRRREILDSMTERLGLLAQSRVDGDRQRLSLLAGRLDALSPLKVLARGYGVIYRDGAAVRDLDALPEGEEVTLQAEKGRRQARLL